MSHGEIPSPQLPPEGHPDPEIFMVFASPVKDNCECEGVCKCEKGEALAPICAYCGLLYWTEREFGRVTHKHACPHRSDRYCQSHPDECPWVPAVDAGPQYGNNES